MELNVGANPLLQVRSGPAVGVYRRGRARVDLDGSWLGLDLARGPYALQMRIAGLSEAERRSRSLPPLDIRGPTWLEVSLASARLHGATYRMDLAEVEANQALQVRHLPSPSFVPQFWIQSPHIPEHFVERDITAGFQAAISGGDGDEFELLAIHVLDGGFRNQDFDKEIGEEFFSRRPLKG